MAKFRFSSLIAAAAVATLTVSPTFAADRQVKVHYSDLDLSTTAGQKTFKSRIARAVRNVCAFPQARTTFERFDQIKCESRAQSIAMNDANKTIARYSSNVKVAVD